MLLGIILLRKKKTKAELNHILWVLMIQISIFYLDFHSGELSKN